MPLINNTIGAFIFGFIVVVIVPIWFLDFVPLSLKWKFMYTIAGGVGLYIALFFGSMRSRR